MKACPKSEIIRKFQIKTKMSYHFTPMKMTINIKMKESVAEIMGKKDPLYSLGGNVNRCKYEKQFRGSTKS